MKTMTLFIYTFIYAVSIPMAAYGDETLYKQYPKIFCATHLIGPSHTSTVYTDIYTASYAVQCGSTSSQSIIGFLGKTGIIAENAILKKLTGDFRFTEGPAADAAGNVYFTDIPNNRIHMWSTDGKLSTFLENSGGANGLYFDKKGNLIACAGGSGKLVSIDKGGNITPLAETYNGKPFNSPNDLWIHPDGGIYFTDPRYGSRENLPQDGEHVYYLSADRKNVIRVIDDMVRPNGVIGTPDGKLLYVADHGAKKTYVYTIGKNGTLSEKKLFAAQGSDGVTIDVSGNIYLTDEAVNVYDKNGILIESIEVPERPSNVCFGGTDKQTLFITARTSFYSIMTHTKGL